MPMPTTPVQQMPPPPQPHPVPRVGRQPVQRPTQQQNPAMAKAGSVKPMLGLCPFGFSCNGYYDQSCPLNHMQIGQGMSSPPSTNFMREQVTQHSGGGAVQIGSADRYKSPAPNWDD